ncbi:MAG: thymidine phosphorylase [Candidatus Levybacteria bacterium]|nr:thymidine phosphorylase [Candidatus Levybacteria bacterium]
MEEKKVNLEHINTQKALIAIRKKLIGKRLNYKEIYSIMDQIAKEKLGNIITTYFAASGYSNGFSSQELYYLTKAMVETGEKLEFKGIVADKHSIGGVPGTRTTLVVVPIVAAAGFCIPKSSSRAITTPSGTADDMETLAKVKFSKEKIYEIVKKTNGCIVWGGAFNIAPADDAIIIVEKPLLFESFDKIIVSIMAKKIAFGSNHVVIDLPYGKTVKVHKLEDVEILKRKFEYIAKKFNIKIRVLIHRTNEPAGRGIGPILETREAIRVLQQKHNRPLDLEIRSINLAGNLLELCLNDSPKKLKEYVRKNFGNSFGWATYILKNGFAFKKMQEIIRVQEGNPNLDSEDLKPGKFIFRLHAQKKSKITNINSSNITIIAKALGAPEQKGAGIYLEKKLGENVEKGELLCTLYSQNSYNLNEAKKRLEDHAIFKLS